MNLYEGALIPRKLSCPKKFLVTRLTFYPKKTSAINIQDIFKILRSHLDYCDINYDKPHNEKFKDAVESFQYNVALTITGAINCASSIKFTT